MKRLTALSITLLVLGAICSAYLLVRYFGVLYESGLSTIDVCKVVLGSDCDATLIDPASIEYGIPLAGWGLVFYAVLAVLLGLGLAQGESFRSEATVGAFLLTAVAVVLGMVLCIMMISGSAPLCLICVAIHIINFGLLIVLKGMTGKSVAQVMVDLKSGVIYLCGGKTEEPIQSGWKLNGFITAGLVGIVVYQLVYILNDERKLEAKQILANHESNELIEIPIDDKDPRRGPNNASVEMVVFSSFQCPGCRVFVPMMNQLRREFDSQLSVVFKHFPLDKACNPVTQIDIHPLSCTAARASEAARNQGKFWEYHDTLYSESLNEEEMLVRAASSNGLDLQKFKGDRSSDTAIARVAADIELGNRLGLKATPAVFLNGRRVQSLNLDVLKILIRHEIEKAHAGSEAK